MWRYVGSIRSGLKQIPLSHKLLIFAGGTIAGFLLITILMGFISRQLF